MRPLPLLAATAVAGLLVITSYSIHYTKLYDRLLGPLLHQYHFVRFGLLDFLIERLNINRLFKKIHGTELHCLDPLFNSGVPGEKNNLQIRIFFSYNFV